MNSKKKQVKIILLLAGLLLVGLFVLQGCKKSEPSGSEVSAEKKQETGEQKWTCSMHPEIISDKPGKCSICGMDLIPQKQEHKAVMVEPTKEVASAAEQATCPIMGNPINKDIFTEYKGKKVYFCCPECKEKFEANPEEYIAKLPQFEE